MPLRRLLRTALVLPLVLSSLLASGAPAAGNDLSDAKARQAQITAQISAQKALIAKLKSQQGQIATDIASAQSALGGINANLADVRARVAATRTALASARATYAQLTAQLKSLNTQLADLGAQTAAKSAELDARKMLLASRLEAAYQQSRIGPLETILMGNSIADALNAAGWLVQMGELDTDLARSIEHDQAVLAGLSAATTATRASTIELRATVDAQRKELAAQAAALATQQARLDALNRKTAALIAARKAAYAKTLTDRAAAEKLLRSLSAAEEKLRNQIAAIIASQSRGSIPSQYNGTLRWPMSGTITQEFGCTGFSWEPPYGSCAHFHSGIDISNALYTPVRAAAAGRVLLAGPNPYESYPQAWIVVIAHSQSLVTWYGHLDNGSHPIPIHAGDWVNQGQIIGYEGMTGHTTGPHLHWAVELNDTFRNPRLFL